MICLTMVSLLHPAVAMAWGEHGHRIAGQAAARTLPAEMPAFFRAAGDQLGYLNPEPDRWRNRDSDPALNGESAPEHFIDMELVPAGALAARDRYAYLVEINKAGRTAAEVGLLPYRILELYQSLRIEFRLWRTAPDEMTRKWIEQRIINDAGILGHYVTDGSNPHHTSIHHHGWVGPNPHGYATDNGFHSRFESKYVETHISIDDLLPAMSAPSKVLGDPRAEILSYLERSHSELENLYEIDKRAKFDAETKAAENKRFAVARLAAGSEMLRRLWWSAWVRSDEPAPAKSGK
jgi:hypothetical protein